MLTIISKIYVIKVIFFSLYDMRVRGGVQVLVYSFSDVALNISRQLQASAALSPVFNEHEAELCSGSVWTGKQVSCPCWESN